MKLSCTLVAAGVVSAIGLVALAQPQKGLDRSDNPKSANAPALPTAMQVLDWLPADTETFVVANGPFQLVPDDPDNPKVNASLGELLQAVCCAGFDVRKGALLKKLAGREVTFAVEGARRLRGPKGLGAALYEGCHILVFRRDLEGAADSLKKALVELANRPEMLAGREVFSLEEKYEEDVWKFFFVRPKPNILVCATDRAYLSELLKRIDRPQEPRALPKGLPEWKHVDTSARYWAVRHFRHFQEGEIGSDLTPHRDDVGLAFAHNPPARADGPSSANVKFLSSTKKLSRIEKEFTYVGFPVGTTLVPKVRQAAPGVFDVTVTLKTPQDAGHFLFVLLFALGHAIAV